MLLGFFLDSGDPTLLSKEQSNKSREKRISNESTCSQGDSCLGPDLPTALDYAGGLGTEGPGRVPCLS